MKRQNQRGQSTPVNDLEINLSTDGVVRIEVISPHVFRFRLADNDKFVEPGHIRYGVFPKSHIRYPSTIKNAAGKVHVETDGAGIEIVKNDGTFTFYDANGTPLVKSAVPPQCKCKQGFAAELEIKPDEKFYGLGDECRDRLNKRGHSTMMWIKNISSYLPIPFLMSTGGWALLVNSTWRHKIDIGKSHPDRVRFSGNFMEKGYGNLDFYLIAGESLPLLLDRYTELAGRPALLPKWAYGFMFINSDWEGARDVLENGLHFRDRKIPCDSLGLEPGWMSKFYDLSVDKQWHPEKFPIPEWVTEKRHTFIGAMEKMGFKLSLWLCCTYDVTWAEEKRLPVQSEFSVERDEELDIKDANLAGHQYLFDSFTKPEQPWFEHLKKFIDQGVSAFKMDAYGTVFEYPDRKWANGMDDLEFHNIYGLIQNKQMYNGFAEYTGKRPMVNSPIGYAGVQQYTTCWAGDTGGGEKPLVCVMNQSLSGNPNCSCDMDVNSKERIHFGFFESWCMVNNFAFWKQPWFLGEELEEMVRFYSQLRSRLIPYIYSNAYLTHLSGLPLVRPMPLAFPDDPKSDELLKQFMFGDAFLITAFTDQVHLPAGRWFDLWSDRCYEGPCDIAYDVPENRGGPAFIHAGAIIPYGPVMSYVDQKPLEQIDLHVYPERSSRFTIFEDDGVTFEYQQGTRALTQIECEASSGIIKLLISPREGKYIGMPEIRRFSLFIRSHEIPRKVVINQQEIKMAKDGGWYYEKSAKFIRLEVDEDPKRSEAIEVVINC